MEDQAKAMAEAQDRWQAQLREGKVRSVTSKEAGELLKDGWTMLDVRPKTEVEKGDVEGSTKVPLFEVDDSTEPGALVKQMSAFGMGGWWLGTQHMVPNEKFVPQALNSIPPEDSKVIVACQKGLRSLAACEQLGRAGYKDLAWINGGFDACEPGELPVKAGKDIRYAGIGGVSSWLGWTDIQQKQGEGLGNIFETVIKICIVLVAVDGVVLIVNYLRQ